jgi:quercetin dioxygenase-like cupin family protein
MIQYCGLPDAAAAWLNNKEEIVIPSRTPRFYWLVAVLTMMVGMVGSAKAPAPELNPAAITYKLPDQIKWTDSASKGAKVAVLFGDPSKPGLYIELLKWAPHYMSRPHYHPHDRYLTVISGTWWVGTGAKYDPDSTVPLPAGTFVTHFGNQIHFDGAKDEETVIEVVGEGPGTSIPADTK